MSETFTAKHLMAPSGFMGFHPDTNLIVVVALIVALVALLSFRIAPWRRRTGSFRRRIATVVKAPKPGLTFENPPTLSSVTFETIPLLNQSEQRLLPILDACCREVGRGHRVMAQTSLGEIIRPHGNSVPPSGKRHFTR